MRRLSFSLLSVAFVLCCTPSALRAQDLNANYDRDPKQPIDQHYTDQILQVHHRPEFLSPLVDYLPASKTVPTPAKVLGDVSGAPDMLPYAEDVYKYFRMLEAASPRVKVFTIGHTEEGREMIAVAIADPSCWPTQKENDARLAQLADPRTIGLDDAKAQRADRQVLPRLLHHRHHPLARNRRAHRADGAGLPAGRRRFALHQVHPLAHDHAHHAGGRSGWPRPHGRHLQAGTRRIPARSGRG